MRKKAVVIGAGRSGRGYLGRLLFEKDYEVTYLEENVELVKLLQEDQAFSIHYFRMDRKPAYITGFQAYKTYTEEARRAIAEADFIYTTVGEQNLPDVAKQLKAGMEGKQKPTVLMACENGISPGKVLRENMQKEGITANYVISQTAIFCITALLEGTRLDIMSEDIVYFPYDCSEWKEQPDFEAVVPVSDFGTLLQRKIFTYNCLTAVIGYSGYLMGMDNYTETSNLPVVYNLLWRTLEELNPSLQAYFGLEKEEQEEFAKNAIKKFTNPYMKDTNMKNARAAKRKLGPKERIMGPLKIVADHGRDPKILQFVAAAALVFWEEQQGLNEEPMLETDPITAICELNNLQKEDPIVTGIEYFWNKIHENRQDIDIEKILGMELR